MRAKAKGTGKPSDSIQPSKGTRNRQETRLTVLVLMVHHVEVIFIAFHVTKEIVRGDVAALGLFIL